VSDQAKFTWLLYHGTTTLRLDEEAFWLTGFGTFMDLLACHWIHNGQATPLLDRHDDINRLFFVEE